MQISHPPTDRTSILRFQRQLLKIHHPTLGHGLKADPKFHQDVFLVKNPCFFKPFKSFGYVYELVMTSNTRRSGLAFAAHRAKQGALPQLSLKILEATSISVPEQQMSCLCWSSRHCNKISNSGFNLIEPKMTHPTHGICLDFVAKNDQSCVTFPNISDVRPGIVGTLSGWLKLLRLERL